MLFGISGGGGLELGGGGGGWAGGTHPGKPPMKTGGTGIVGIILKLKFGAPGAPELNQLGCGKN